eukprot:1570283-Rhodomonas_salina.1
MSSVQICSIMNVEVPQAYLCRPLVCFIIICPHLSLEKKNQINPAGVSAYRIGLGIAWES